MSRGRSKFLKQPWALNRLKLYTSGVKLPKLGSIQDTILQGFLSKEREKEVLVNKLLVNVAVGTMAGSPNAVSEIISGWNRYVALAYGAEGLQEEVLMNEQTMRIEYEKYRQTKVTVHWDKNKNVTIKGLGIPDSIPKKPLDKSKI